MADGPADLLPPLLFPSDDPAERRWLASLRAQKRIRRAGPRLYVSVPKAEVAATLRRSWATILAALFPDALITHRTALEFQPDAKGTVYLTAPFGRRVTYPGLVFQFVKGPPALPDDPRFMGIRAASQARALLENMAAPRSGGRRVLPTAQLETYLERLLHAGGEAELNALRDRARVIAKKLGWHAKLRRLDALIGGLLGTRTAELVTATARARAAGEPFDAACIERMQLLYAELRLPRPPLAEPRTAPAHVRNKAFFESYFSNYIEGTTFEIAEAEAIVFDRRIPAARPRDAHDILGTFEIVSDPAEMRRVPATPGTLVELLQRRHARMLADRSDAQPGVFKTAPNRAGDTHFVHPEYVRGTLRAGHEIYASLPAGLPRAVAMAVLVSEVHPFVDGNGRIARIMMNAELVAAGQVTIIVPTVYREDYLLALRALTRRNRPQPIVDALVRAQRFSNRDFAAYPAALAALTRRNWFREPDDAKLDDRLRES
ncbi:MAG TPA: Fic family protein [Kofleriaceae bacterium]|jgi:hypothetical protein